MIVDDEVSAIEALSLLIQKFTPEVEIVGTAQNVPDAIALIQQTHPDLVFLDIEMPGKNGFELLQAFDPPQFDIVFSTAHLHYAIRAIRFAALDFLLKPVDPVELMQLVKRKLKQQTILTPEQISASKPIFSGENPELIALPTQTGFLFRPIGTIIRMEADNNYTRIYFEQESPVLVSKTLKNFEEILPETLFLRIHRSHIIRVKEVREFVRAKTPSVILADGTELPVASDKKDALFHRLLSPS
jgi:two-component system LytT family response regulator